MSKEIKIFRNAVKTRNLLITSGLTCLVLGITFMYGLGLFDDIFKIKVTIGSGAVLIIMLILLIKNVMNLTDKSAIFELNENSLNGKTSPLSRAIGNINWEDITEIKIQKVGGDTLVVLGVRNADYYQSKLSKMLWNLAYDKQSQELQIMYSASEIEMKIDQLYDLFLSYWQGKKNQLQ